ncbi:MAG: YgiW/YdeI family stress tolerance OB fold protein [Vibrio sp.]
MKKTLLTVTLATLFALPTAVMAEVVSPTNNAAPQSQGGFQGPKHGPQLIESVKAAKDAKDDAKVVLTGKIKSSLGDEDYIFVDAAGDEITVEIDDHKWNGRTVTTDHTIVVYGEVDKDWNSVTVDADRIEVK